VQAEALVGVPARNQRIVLEGEVPDDRVVVSLRPAGTTPYVVIGPPAAEILVPQGKLSDHLGELRVPLVASGRQVQGDDYSARGVHPVDGQIPGCVVEEDEASHVPVAVRERVEVGEECLAQTVGGQDAEAAPAARGGGLATRAVPLVFSWIQKALRTREKKQMELRILGGTGISVSEFALGTMMFGAMGNTDHDDSVRMIHSAFPPEQIVKAQWVAERRGHQRFRTEQPPYSILLRGIEAGMLPTAQRYGLGVLTFGPPSSGWLSGRANPAGGHRNAGLGARLFDLSVPGNQATVAVVEKLVEAGSRSRRLG
jgi:hypothetical protein